MKLFFVDLETTGVNVEKNGITQIAAQIVVDGTEVQRLDYKVRPFKGQIISQEALEITGTSIEELRSFPEPQLVYSQLSEELGRYVKKFDKSDKFMFIAYNSMFDNTFLRKFWENNGDKYFGSWFWYPPICVMQSAMAVLAPVRHQMPNFKLGTVANFLGLISEEEATKLHDAGMDIELAKRIYYYLVDVGAIKADVEAR